jgi:hypothetical protein
MTSVSNWGFSPVNRAYLPDLEVVFPLHEMLMQQQQSS